MTRFRAWLVVSGWIMASAAAVSLLLGLAVWWG